MFSFTRLTSFKFKVAKAGEPKEQQIDQQDEAQGDSSLERMKGVEGNVDLLAELRKWDPPPSLEMFGKSSRFSKSKKSSKKENGIANMAGFSSERARKSSVSGMSKSNCDVEIFPALIEDDLLSCFDEQFGWCAQTSSQIF